jgi:hypothetical protein
MSALDRLGDANADLVEQAIDLLAELDDRLFSRTPRTAHAAASGAARPWRTSLSLLDGFPGAPRRLRRRKRILFEQSRAYATRARGLAERLRGSGP